ncbi:MAG: SH3 domain-containing protein [Bacteroidota bacterium]
MKMLLLPLLAILSLPSSLLSQHICDNDFKFVTAESGLRVRNAPNLDAEVVRVAKFGDAVQQIEIMSDEIITSNDKGHWVKVNYRDTIGYMFDRYLSKLPRFDLKILTQYRGEYPIYPLSRYFHLTLFEIAERSGRVIVDCGGDPDCKQGVSQTTRYLNKGFQLTETFSWDAFDEEVIGENWSYEDAKSLVDWIINSAWKDQYKLQTKDNSCIYQNSNYTITVTKLDASTTSVRWETSH